MTPPHDIAALWSPRGNDAAAPSFFVHHRVLLWRGLGVACGALVLIGGVVFMPRTQAPLTIAFLDVGQGDALLLTAGKRQLLVDTGPNGTQLLAALGSVMPFYDRSLDLVVVTHPDADHIGGTGALLERYRVAHVLVAPWTEATPYAQNVAQSLNADDRPITDVNADSTIDLTPRVRVTVLSPHPETHGDTNARSIVLLVALDGKPVALLTGDAPSRVEDALTIGDIDLLKVAHHGSSSSTSDALLSQTTPNTAIISVGANNRYGHPSPDVVERLAAHGIPTLRTDERGTIIATCMDGNTPCTVKTWR